MKRLSFLAAIAGIVTAVAAPISAPADGFKAGAAAVVITPPPGTPMAGYYYLRAADGVLDDIYAKAMVVEQDGAKAAFVTLDLITVTRSVTLAARKLIAEQTGIPPERVMISATHSHTGPVLTRGSTLDELTGASTPAGQDYTHSLPLLIARSVSEANGKLTPARATATAGREDSLSFNRRAWLDDGTVGWNVPKLSPKIVAPAGPIDPDVGVLYIESTAKDVVPLATYVNFAMHADTVGGTKISADFPGSLSRLMSGYKGPQMVTLFANGCCGNLNHCNHWWTDPQRGPREAERIGTVLTGAVLKTWPNLRPLSTKAPHARATLVTLPLPQFSDKEIEESRAVVQRMTDPKIGTVAKAKACCVVDTIARNGVSLEVEVQAIVFSEDLAIVALPGEMFVELGLALKKASPFKHTFIAELANGSVGYIPNRSAYAEGNYEVVSSRCAEGSGEMLVDAALQLLRELRSPDASSR